MFRNATVLFLALFMAVGMFSANSALAGHDIDDLNETDIAGDQLVSFFDLRDRDSFVQVTNTNTGLGQTIHVQIFNAADACQEVNFHDTLTPGDTHTYDLRDLVRNIGGPVQTVVPDGAYGAVIISAVVSENNNSIGTPLGSDSTGAEVLIGNFRVVDNSGYEYRTNSVDIEEFPESTNEEDFITFNFSERGSSTFSDVVAFVMDVENDSDENVRMSNVDDISESFETFIVNNAEQQASCRTIGIACVEEDDNIFQTVVDELNVSTVGLDYGINEAIPGSRSDELLCPGNSFSEGYVRFRDSDSANDCDDCDQFIGFIGLNDGNTRGSMDTFWKSNSNDDPDSGVPTIANPNN